MPDLSIVIVSYNTRDLLAKCLTSVSIAARGIDHEVLVVDNGSTDGSAGMVARDFPSVALTCSRRNLGFAGANNLAIRASSGRYLLLLNSDAFLDPEVPRLMLDFMESHPEAGVVGGLLLNPDGSFQGSYADFPSLLDELLLLTKLHRLARSSTFPSYPAEQSGEVRSVDWVFGACMMVRRSAIHAAGLLDEEYFMYTEETDWCYRIGQAGWKVYYLPGARVIHHGGQSAAKIPERRRHQLYRSKVLFLRKHRGRAPAAFFYLLVLATSVLKLAMWGLLSLAPGGERRERACQQVRSYSYLLGER